MMRPENPDPTLTTELQRDTKPDNIAHADAVLHPNGRCTCAGEGRCAWCKTAQADRDGKEVAAEAEAAPRKRMAIHVDPEMTLDARICRLEELEVLRIAVYEANEQMGAAQDVKNRLFWKDKLEEGQKKIGQILNAIGQAVRARLNVRDLRKSAS